jgi:hypothetical protein
MSDYDKAERKVGTGALFTNRKQGNGIPNWKGELRVSEHYAPGDTIKIAGWTKDTSGGLPLISLKEDNWQPAAHTGGGNRNPAPSKRKDDEDIPF